MQRSVCVDQTIKKERDDEPLIGMAHFSCAVQFLSCYERKTANGWGKRSEMQSITPEQSKRHRAVKGHRPLSGNDEK